MSKQKKTRNSHKTANPALALAMREIRRSSAASPHVPGHRKGTRRNNQRRAIREQLAY